ncbi:MAG TPA: hypothetical protein VFT13_02670, partial [Candidatus Krumholzibacteria bacterium]|nr:hypothetical protein [Candidatus Krumholzibacteria bacterium]
PREEARRGPARGRSAAPTGGTLTSIAFDASGAMFLGSTEGLGLVTAGGIRWLRAADGTGGGEVSDLVVDDGHLWVGFARDGLSVLPIERLR